MSKKKKNNEYVPMPIYHSTNNCFCSLPQLAMLILVILQFSDFGSERKGEKSQQISNEILFIITLYFLSCIECNRTKSYCVRCF